MNTKLRVLQVGCGGISNNWLTTLSARDDIEIVGLVDLDKNNAINKKNDFHLTCDTYTDFEKAIADTTPDVVIDNTIPEIHHKIVTTSLKSGCNVFGEKPLADTMENAIDMIKTADTLNKSYSVMQNRRFLKDIRNFQSIIEKQMIGELGFLGASFYIEAHFGGFRDIMDSPLILDMAIHTFDQARFISGCDPISVYCHEFNPSGSWYKGNASAVCIFEMTDNVVFSYNGSWCSKGNLTSWECDWRAMGSAGAARWDGKSAPWHEKQSDRQNMFPSEYERNIISNNANSQEGHAGCINDMIDSLKKGLPSQTDCKDNIKSLAMVMAAIKSSREKRKVFIDEIINI
ncbi:Gfo/Idh/MocA family oxidoreductase [Vallitalea sediminicola]